MAVTLARAASPEMRAANYCAEGRRRSFRSRCGQDRSRNPAMDKMLFDAIFRRCTASAEEAVDGGADVNATFGSIAGSGFGVARAGRSALLADLTPLMCAASMADPDTIRFLISRKADVNATNANGDTALSIAQAMCCREAVEMLRGSGARS